jgi:predicted methyltransferase
MKRVSFACILSTFVVVACASEPPPEPVAPEAPPPPPAIAEPPPPAPAPPPPPEPTAEEKKKAKDLAELNADRAKWEAAHKQELTRWTPELRAEAKALAEKNFPSAKAALQAAVAGKHRQPGHADRDKYRHPIETLEFFGFRPTMTVLEYGPGEGWYTELLAPALAKKGKLIVTNSDASGPPDQRSTFYGQRLNAFLQTSPELYGKVQPIVVDSKAPKLGLTGTVDLVIVARAMHGMHNNGVLKSWLAEMHAALKPNGTLGIEQHRANPDANPDESSKKGYLPEKWVIEQVEAAGFKLRGKSEVNANPKDTKDYAEGVWSLPPTLRQGDKDRDKLVAIGESDRMTLKFAKVAKPGEKPAVAAGAGGGAKPAAKADAKPAQPAAKADAAKPKPDAAKPDAAKKDPAPKK